MLRRLLSITIVCTGIRSETRAAYSLIAVRKAGRFSSLSVRPAASVCPPNFSQRSAQAEIARLAYSRKQEIDPDDFQYFLEGISQLTPTERKIFDLYLEGKNAKEIIAILGVTENTLKFHNKNIYNKLGVSSRKQLLRYATLMKQQEENDQQ